LIQVYFPHLLTPFLRRHGFWQGNAFVSGGKQKLLNDLQIIASPLFWSDIMKIFLKDKDIFKYFARFFMECSHICQRILLKLSITEN